MLDFLLYKYVLSIVLVGGRRPSSVVLEGNGWKLMSMIPFVVDFPTCIWMLELSI